MLTELRKRIDLNADYQNPADNGRARSRHFILAKRSLQQSWPCLCCCSGSQSCPILCDTTNCNTLGLPVHHHSWSLLKLTSIVSVTSSNHLFLCQSLLFPPSIFPSIRVFSNESVLRIRQPKHWGFSFSISPSNEYSGLISFRK